MLGFTNLVKNDWIWRFTLEVSTIFLICKRLTLSVGRLRVCPRSRKLWVLEAGLNSGSPAPESECLTSMPHCLCWWINGICIKEGSKNRTKLSSSDLIFSGWCCAYSGGKGRERRTAKSKICWAEWCQRADTAGKRPSWSPKGSFFWGSGGWGQGWRMKEGGGLGQAVHHSCSYSCTHSATHVHTHTTP